MPENKRRRREPIVLSQMRPVTLLLVLCGCILFTFALINISSVGEFFGKILSALGPVIAGAIFAYILAPAASWLERRFNGLLKKPIEKHPKLAKFTRGLSAFLAVSLFVGSLTLLVIAVSSQVAEGVSTLLDRLPDYIQSLTDTAEDLLHRDSRFSKMLQDLSERFLNTELGMGQVDTVELSQRILSTLASGAAGTLGFLYDVVVGFIIAVYLLISRERFIKQFRQILYACTRKKIADQISEKMQSASNTFGTAVLGKFVDSVIIGMLCFIGMTILRMPYTTLIAAVIGTTNMIPFFGPIIGAIPCVLLVFMESPIKALYFLIFVVVLQQFDANILDPRIVGSSIGLPAFWELFACMLGGGLFGIAGLIVGVPAFAVIYELVRELVGARLGRRVRAGELEEDFVRGTLGVEEMPDFDSGDDDDDLPDSPYVQNLIMLEEIAQPPERRQEESGSISDGY